MNKKRIKENKSKIESNSIQKNIAKASIENNYNIEHISGTEAYYSERYGWTLRRSK